VSKKRMKTKDKVLTGCGIDEELWLDLIEGEIEPSMKQDLNLHKVHCKDCQKIFTELGATKTIIKTPELDMPNDDFFAKLESKIMASLDEKVSRNTGYSTSTAAARIYAFGRSYSAPLAATAALFLLIFGALYKGTGFNAQPRIEFTQAKLEEQFIAQAAYNDPKAMSNAMISHQDEDDLVMGATAEELSHMSEKEAARMIANLR
jgi:hypothetical protein